MADAPEETVAGLKPAGDDVVIPFQVDPLDIRGRAVQLGPAVDRILKQHDYPDAVSMMLGEMIVLAVLLGTSLKFSGNFILQTQTDGPVSLAVVDFSTPDAIRAYARFDEKSVADAVSAGNVSPNQLLGHGVLAMTIDQGLDMQRYQGIVSLDGCSLEEAAHQYFRQSEQIPTRLRLASAKMIRPGGGSDTAEETWRAGGILVQFLPEARERIAQMDLPGGDGDEVASEIAEDQAWVEARALAETVSDDELTDPGIPSERLLFRLFNEHGVRVHDGTGVTNRCSCSREKVVDLVRSFPETDDDPQEEVVTKCEFCGTVYTIPAGEIAGKAG